MRRFLASRRWAGLRILAFVCAGNPAPRFEWSSIPAQGRPGATCIMLEFSITQLSIMKAAGAWLTPLLPTLYLVFTAAVAFLLGVWITRLLLRHRQELAVKDCASVLNTQIATLSLS